MDLVNSFLWSLWRDCLGILVPEVLKGVSARVVEGRLGMSRYEWGGDVSRGRFHEPPSSLLSQKCFARDSSDEAGEVSLLLPNTKKRLLKIFWGGWFHSPHPNSQHGTAYL